MVKRISDEEYFQRVADAACRIEDVTGTISVEVAPLIDNEFLRDMLLDFRELEPDAIPDVVLREVVTAIKQLERHLRAHAQLSIMGPRMPRKNRRALKKVLAMIEADIKTAGDRVLMLARMPSFVDEKYAN